MLRKLKGNPYMRLGIAGDEIPFTAVLIGRQNGNGVAEYCKPKWSFVRMDTKSLMNKARGVFRCRQTGELRSILLG